MYKHDNVCKQTGRKRAVKLFPKIGRCSICGNEKSERHHIDGNTTNNNVSNIKILCRRCHMKADGRLDNLSKIGKRIIAIAGPIAWKAKLKNNYCKHGHLYTGINSNGARICRTCMRLSEEKYRQKKFEVTDMSSRIR